MISECQTANRNEKGEKGVPQSDIGLPIPLSLNTFESISLRHINRERMEMIA